MSIDFDALTTTALSEAFPERRRIPGLAASLAGDADLRALARRLAGATSCITMLAGSGSRWVSSLAEAAAASSGAGNAR